MLKQNGKIKANAVNFVAFLNVVTVKMLEYNRLAVVVLEILSRIRLDS